MSYFSDFWNINDLISVLITFIYCNLRLNLFGTSPKWAGNFILIKNIEFGESHLESEIILDNL